MKKSRDIKGKYTRGVTDDMYGNYPIYTDTKGYKVIWVGGRGVKLHVYVWESEHGQKPQGFDIHHIDGAKWNYELSNLQLLSHSDHRRVHAGWIMTDGEWTHKPCTCCGDVFTINNFYKRKGYTPTAMCKKCHCVYSKQWATNNPEKRKKIANAYTKRQREKGD